MSNPFEKLSTTVALTQPDVDTPQTTTESVLLRVRKLVRGVWKKALARVFSKTHSFCNGATSGGIVLSCSEIEGESAFDLVARPVNGVSIAALLVNMTGYSRRRNRGGRGGSLHNAQ